MAVTIHVNGASNSLVHKGSSGIAKNTLPDVCKTPSPGGPVPVPYPVIISMSSDLKKGTKTVKVDGGNMAAIKGSEFSRCTGDEAGTAGGVKSSTNMKEATWITYSFDVKLDGKNACRLSDKMQMNHGNTVCLAGFVQKPVPRSLEKEKKEECKKAKKSRAEAKSANPEADVTAGARFLPAKGGSMSQRASNMIGMKAVRPGGRFRRFAKGLGMSLKSKIPGNPKYPSTRVAGHAEKKILEDIFGGRIPGVLKSGGPSPVGGRLYLSVKGKAICCTCQTTMTNAQNAGLTIYLCPGTKLKKPCP